MIDPTAFVHPMALCEGSTVGARTRIWQFASVIRGARIGADCNIASGACIDGSVVGDHSIICHNVAMGPGFLIGSGCFIGPGVVLCNDMWPRAVKQGWSIAPFQNGALAIVIKDGASMGANSTALPGITIGRNAFVAAGAVAVRDVPDDHLLARDGSVKPLPDNLLDRRMRLVEGFRSAKVA
ncbi:MAG TPA: DapH/DapD/GlmU-related protein [Hyphomonas sp.]|nr:DapH/DapD/GlmU-related protein [Hyphomonas sp.]